MNYFKQESNRLYYRKLTNDDIESWLEFFENNDRLEFMGMNSTQDSRILATEWITKQITRYKESGLGQLAVIEKATNCLIGVSGIIPRVLNGNTFFEISYSFKPNKWGKGFGTEAASHIKEFGIANEVSDKYISIIHNKNLDSMRVAEKNGMSPLFETTFMNFDAIVFGDK